MNHKTQSNLAAIVVIVVVLIGMLVLGIMVLVGWAYARQQQVVQRQADVTANLREIGQALHNYQAEHGLIDPKIASVPKKTRPIACEVRPSADNRCQVEVLFVNRTSEPISVPLYQLLQEEPGFVPFEVEREGQPVDFTGKLIKRNADSIAKKEIAPGETVTSKFDLCDFYELDSDLNGVRIRYQALWQLGGDFEDVESDWVELVPPEN